MSAGRFYASELRLVLLRRRNLLLLAVTALFPLVIGIALRLAAPSPQGDPDDEREQRGHRQEQEVPPAEQNEPQFRGIKPER